jgi:hypothetical protein
VTFAWSEGGAVKTSDHVFDGAVGVEQEWKLVTGQNIETLWVEYAPVLK